MTAGLRPRVPWMRRFAVGVFALCLAPLWAGCDTPYTYVVLQNAYPPSNTDALVIDQAVWQAVFFTTPLLPGSASQPESTIAASANTAYVLLAPGWNPAGSAPPTSLVVLQSRAGYSVSLNQTLTIRVDDVTFAGNCADGSSLPQQQADFLTQTVFASAFTGLSYDAATCTTTPLSDAGTH